MIHPAHKDQGAFGDEAADEVLPCEVFVEGFFVARALSAFVGEEGGAEGGEGGWD